VTSNGMQTEGRTGFQSYNIDSNSVVLSSSAINFMIFMFSHFDKNHVTTLQKIPTIRYLESTVLKLFFA